MMRTVRRRLVWWAGLLACASHLLVLLASRPGWHSEWGRAAATISFGAVFAGPLLAGVAATVLVVSRRPGLDEVIRASSRSVASDARLIGALAAGAVVGTLGAVGIGLTITLVSGTGGRPGVDLIPGLLGGLGFVLGAIAAGAAVGRLLGHLVAGPLAACGLLFAATFLSANIGSAVTRPADVTATLVGLRPSLEYNGLQFVWFVGLGALLACLAWVVRSDRHPAVLTVGVAAALLVVPSYSRLATAVEPFETKRPAVVCDRGATPAVCVATDHEQSLARVADTARHAWAIARRDGLQPRPVLIQIGNHLRIGIRDGESPLPSEIAGLDTGDVLDALATDAAVRCHPGRDISDREARAILIIGEHAGGHPANPFSDPRMSDGDIVRIGEALAACAPDAALADLGVGLR